jgi:hypothetical protein
MPEIIEGQKAAASSPPAVESGRENATGATEKSPNSPGANEAGSPTAQDNKPPTFADTLGQAKELLGKDLPEQGAGEEAADKSATAKPDTAEATPAEQAAKDEQARKAAEAEKGSDAAFNERQEWKDLATAMPKEAWDKARPIVRKLLERENALNSQLTQAKPDLDTLKEFKTLTGDEKGFEFFRNVTRLFAASDPKGIPILEGMLKQLRERNGMVIQSPDLAARSKEIDDAANLGKMTPEQAEAHKADLLKIEEARAGQKQTQAQLEAQRQREQQSRVETQSRANQTALDDWEGSIRTKDADFGNVTEESDPQHGVSKADQVMSELTASLQAKPPRNQQELVAAAQKAYDVVNRRMAAYLPKPKPIKAPIGSDSSSRTAKVKPKGFKETSEAATSILYGSAT